MVAPRSQVCHYAEFYRLFWTRIFAGKDFSYTVLGYPNGGGIIALMIAADGYSPEKIQSRSHQSPRVTVLD